MQRYLLFRLAQAVLCIFAVLVIVFLLGRLSGNPVDLMLPPEATEEDRLVLEEHLGLNEPLIDQFGLYVRSIFEGDFGVSVRTQRPTIDMFMERFPATLQLAVAGMLLAILIGIPIGVYSAVKRGHILDYAARLIAVLGQSMPSFFMGIMLMYLFAVTLGWLPTSGRGGLDHLILPTVTLAWGLSAGIMRLSRSSMLDVLGEEYIKLARIKGVSQFKVVWKHAFKNASIPVLTMIFMVFAYLLTGTVIVEVIFAWPGVGRLMYDSIYQRDFPVIQTVVLILSTLMIAANLAADILYAYLNPKIRHGR